MQNTLAALISSLFIACLAACSGGGSSGGADTGKTIQVDFRPGLSETAGQIYHLPDGKMLMRVNVGGDCTLGRLNSNGTVDRAFGNNGLLDIDICRDPLLETDGRFLLANTNSHGIYLYRFLADGTPDLSFSGDGIAGLPNDYENYPNITAFTQLPDGSFRLALSAYNSTRLSIFSIDHEGNPLFAPNEPLLIDDGTDIDEFTHILFQPDGKLLLLGMKKLELNYLYFAAKDIVLLRYNPDGTLDDSFATNGKFVLSQHESYLPGNLGLQSNGRIIVSLQLAYYWNYLERLASGEKQTLLVGLTTDGIMDNSFGQEGIVAGKQTFELFIPAEMTINSDDSIMMNLTSFYAPEDRWELGRHELHIQSMRILPQGEPDPNFNNASYSTVKISICNFSLVSFSVDHNQSAWVNINNSCQEENTITLLPLGENGEPIDLLPAMATHRATIDLGLHEELVAMHMDATGFITLAGHARPDCLALARVDTQGLSTPGLADQNGIFGCTRFSANPVYYETTNITGMAVASDGSTLLSGEIISDDGNQTTTYSVVMRRLANGKPDTDFADNGRMVIDRCPPSDVYNSESFQKIALQADGKFIVASRACQSEYPDGAISISRYLADGTPDSSFNGTGHLVTDILPGGVSQILVQTDGKIVAGSWHKMIRLLPDGSIDHNFGNVLPVQFNMNTTNILQQADNKLVACGSDDVYYEDYGTTTFYAYRLNAYGSRDTAFGDNGEIMEDLPMGGRMSDPHCTLQPDGKLVIAGLYTSFPPEKFLNEIVVFRYNIDGSRDLFFGQSGKVMTHFNRWTAYLAGVGIQPDGKIVVAGTTVTDTVDFMLVRFNANGSVDNTYGQ